MIDENAGMTKRTKAILSLGGVFLLGALCGALALGTFVRSEVRNASRLRDSAGFREYFNDQLELTTAQRDSLQSELDWFYGAIAGLRAAAAGEYHDLIDSLDSRIVGHLSADQIRRLRETEIRLRKHVESRRPRAEAKPQVKPDNGLTAGTEAAPEAPESASPWKPKTTAPITSQSNVRADTANAGASPDTDEPDPGEEIFRDGLKERLGLSKPQVMQIRSIVKSTRRAIRRDAQSLRTFPRLQLEAAMRHLREMDRDIDALLDEKQRAKYAPVREAIRSRMKSQLMKHLRNRGRLGAPRSSDPPVEAPVIE